MYLLNFQKKTIRSLLMITALMISGIGFVSASMLDTDRPSVVINQKIGQSDPATNSPILFSVVFSEPINTATFTTGSISTSGSTIENITIDTINEVSPYDGTTFEVSISTIGVGNVTLTIPSPSTYTSSIVANVGLNPNDIIIDSAGIIYTANAGDNTVSKITTDGTSTILGTTGQNPVSIIIDSAGIIYTANAGDNTVSKITTDGTSTILGTTGQNPNDLVMDSAGNIYTVNASSNDITKITPDGTSTIFASIPGCSYSMAIDNSDTIYTANYCTMNVSKITPDGISTIIGPTGTTPYGIIVDIMGNIYTTNLFDFNVSKITPDGISTIIGPTGTYGYSLTIDNTNHSIYIVNKFGNDVTKLFPDGILDLAGNGNNQSTSEDNIVLVVNDTPVVTLSGGSIVKIAQGSIYVDAGASWVDYSDGSGNQMNGIYTTTGSFQSSGNVDTAVAGRYSIEYLKVDTIGNISELVTREVSVMDITPPSVVINKKIEQSDPTTSHNALFTAIFSEPINISTFTTKSISSSGSTATGVIINSITEVSPHNGTTFDISVSTSGTGTVILNIPNASSLIFGTTGTNPNTIVMDADGNIYTANYGDNTISKITPDGTSSIFGTTGANPSAIAYYDGNIYVTNAGDNTISKITPDGTSSIFGTTGANPSAIAYYDGNIYVTNAGDNTISKITPDGTSSIFGTTGANPSAIDMQIDRSERLYMYVSNAGDNTVTRIDLDGNSVVFGTTGLNPSGITGIDFNENIYVSNAGDNTVTRIDSNGTSSIFGITGANPSAISIDEYGNLYTINSGDSTVTRIDLNGKSTILGITGANPRGIILDNSSAIYTANYNDNTISKINLIESSIQIGTTGSFPYGGILIDALGNIYTANYGDNTVSKITPDGTSTVLGTTGANPLGILMNSLGNIYTVNGASNNVSKITPDGTSIILGTTGTNPRGITGDSAGNIYTANAGDNTVSKITPDGTSTVLGTTGANPQGIAIDISGNIYTANNDDTVSKITPDGISTILGTTGGAPSRIILDTNGNIYTMNLGDSTITKITPDGISTRFGSIPTIGESSQYITIDHNNIIYVADYSSRQIFKITPDGTTTIVGKTDSGPHAITIDIAGNIYTANNDDTVSKITAPSKILDLAGNPNRASTSIDNIITISSIVIPQAPPSTSASNGGGGSTTNIIDISIIPVPGISHLNKISIPQLEDLRIGIVANTIHKLPIKNTFTNTLEFLSANDPLSMTSLSSQSNIITSGNTITGESIFELTERATEYICPNIVQVYSESEIRTQDITSLTYNDNIKALIMFRGVTNKEGNNLTISEEYKNSGIVLNQNTFEPNREITRSEYIKIIAKSLACRYQYTGMDSGFPDVNKNEGYAEYITYAVKNGWITGYDDGTFRPNNPITRAEAAKILANAIQIKPSFSMISSFKDVSTTNKFFPYIESMREKGILSGKTETTFEPESYLSRDEAAHIIYKTFLGGHR